MRRIGRRSGGDHSMTRRHGTRSCASIKRTSLEFYGVGVFCACARSAVAPVRTECVVSEPAGIPAALHSTFSRPQPSNVSRYTFLVVLGFFVSRAPRPSRACAACERLSVVFDGLSVHLQVVLRRHDAFCFSPRFCRFADAREGAFERRGLNYNLSLILTDPIYSRRALSSSGNT